MLALRVKFVLLVGLMEAAAGAAQQLPRELYELPLCLPGTNPDFPPDYKLPHTSIEEIDAFLATNFPYDSDPLSLFVPDTVVIVGGSKGIGRANACYFASLSSKVISLATTLPADDGSDLSSPIDCPDARFIVNIEYDITKPDTAPQISDILEQNNVDAIDLLLLNAGRDNLGALRDWEVSDLQLAFANNVFGLHDIWRQARDYLNPDLAVVLGVSSVAAEERFHSRRYVYHLTKHAVQDLLIGYAYEEEFDQPNTHYGVILQNEVKTNFGLTRISPKNGGCEDEFAMFGAASNQGLSSDGEDVLQVAEKYHKIYARLAGANYLMNACESIERSDFPQTFYIQSPMAAIDIHKAGFNHRILPSEATNQCYGEFWNETASFLMAGCPDGSGGFACPAGTGAQFVPLVDPRVVQPCAGGDGN